MELSDGMSEENCENSEASKNHIFLVEQLYRVKGNNSSHIYSVIMSVIGLIFGNGTKDIEQGKMERIFRYFLY